MIMINVKNTYKLTLVALTVMTAVSPVRAANIDCSNATPIYVIQGDSATSPLVQKGQFESAAEVVVQGVVTAKSDKLSKGFYLQDLNGDGDLQTSDGVFIYLGKAAPKDINIGDKVCVQGKVQEHYGLTQINLAQTPDNYQVLEHGDPIAAVPFTLDDGEPLSHALERVEGMKVKLDQNSDMLVSRNFGFDYSAHRANMALSYKAPLIHPTQLYHGLTPEAMMLAKANQLNQLIIDSDHKSQHSQIPYFSDFNPEDGYIRIGDKLNGLEGMITYSYGAYRLMPTNQITKGDIDHTMDRTEAPARSADTDIRVASFNVLNFFNESVGGAKNPTATNRGAKNDVDFDLQRTKIIHAIGAMNADIVGLMEVENNGFGQDSAIQSLQDGINDQFKDPTDHYEFVKIADKDKIKGQYFGTDAITVGMLYRPAKVSLKDAAFIIKTPEQHVPAGSVSRTHPKTHKVETNAKKTAHQRWSLAQSFVVKSSGDPLTVVVNHLKSKGSDCIEDWQVFEGRDENAPKDLQGHCVEFRLSAVKVLGERLKSVKGDVLFIGDMNSYSMEDPIWALTDYKAGNDVRHLYTASFTTLDGKTFEATGTAITQGYGYVNLSNLAKVRALHEGEQVFSYSYGGELGSLDHALGSQSLVKRVVDVNDWHINSAESDQFEYGHKFGSKLEKSSNPFSATDHDPVMIDLHYAKQASPSVIPTQENDGGALGILGLSAMALFGFVRQRLIIK